MTKTPYDKDNKPPTRDANDIPIRRPTLLEAMSEHIIKRWRDKGITINEKPPSTGKIIATFPPRYKSEAEQKE